MKNINSERIIEGLKVNEASFSRLYIHLERGDAVAIISANRSENTEEENENNYQHMMAAVTRARFGYNRVIGGYRENGREVEEKSLVLYASKDRAKELKDLAVMIGRKYKQDSILYFDGETGEGKYIATRSDSKYGGRAFKSDFDIHDIEDYYTNIGNKAFRFMEISEDVEPESYRSFVNKVANTDWKRIYTKYGEHALEEWDKMTNYGGEQVL